MSGQKEGPQSQEPRSQWGGRLYVVATPIGNLSDIGLRALEVLGGVDCVFAEDTRNSAHLLTHHGIRTPLKALHAHNEAGAAAEVLHILSAGGSAALISDAGTPAISDPGALLVRTVRAQGHPVVPVPGANAAVCALSAAGFDGPFLFVGFLPAKSAARRSAVQQWRHFSHHLVFYEAPHRVRETVADLAEVLGPTRQIAIARELTKLFETIHVCGLGAAGEWLDADANRQRGEFVLIVEGTPVESDEARTQGERALRLLLEELPLASAARLAAGLSGARKGDLYEYGLSLKESGKE